MLALIALCLLPQDLDSIRDRIKDPAQIFPVFQELVAAGEYGTARELLSPAAKKLLPPEAFYLAFASFEPPRRMVASLQMHGGGGIGISQKSGEPSREVVGDIFLCSRDFGVSRRIKLAKFMTMYTLDFSSEDLEFLKGRTLGWYRLQVKRADGWHYAYPPDWTYAPLARSCVCGK